MTGWHFLFGALALAGIVAAAYGLDRLGLWLEDRGLLYYRRKKPSSSPASMWVAMQQYMEPGVKHVVEMGQGAKADDHEANKARLTREARASLDRLGRRPAAERDLRK